MSTRESQQTKATLQTHKEDFKNIHTEAQALQREIQNKIYEEITKLDEQDRKEMARYKNRKKMLALKGEIDDPYVQEEKGNVDVPVDGDLKAGSMVYMQNCASCHSLEAIDPRPSRGPSLGLIYNRKAGSNTSFQTYGMDLLKANFYWTARNLYNFMGNTKLLLPKTNCWLATHPLRDESDRADLLALFKDFTSQLMFNMRLKQVEKHGYIRYQTQLNSHKMQKLRGQQREQSDKSRERKL